MFHKRLVLLIVVLVIGSLIGAPIAAAQIQPDIASLNGPDQGRGDSVHVTGKLIMSGVTVEQLYSFVSDLENDTQWYLGTVSSMLVSGDGGRGSVYQEVVVFDLGAGPVAFDVTATVLHLVPNRHVRFRSNGIFINETQYHMKTLNDGRVEFVVDSFVELPPGAPAAFIVDYLKAVLNQLATVLGVANPTIIVPAHGKQQL
jgi:hypothetical protein